MAQPPESYRAFMAAFFVGWPDIAQQHYVDIFSRVLLSPGISALGAGIGAYLRNDVQSESIR
jgi:hypothetical protein